MVVAVSVIMVVMLVVVSIVMHVAVLDEARAVRARAVLGDSQDDVKPVRLWDLVGRFPERAAVGETEYLIRAALSPRHQADRRGAGQPEARRHALLENRQLDYPALRFDPLQLGSVDAIAAERLEIVGVAMAVAAALQVTPCADRDPAAEAD